MELMSRSLRKFFWIALFSVAFALVEAAVVVYLRAIYYPGGFTFPLNVISPAHFGVELAREASTIAMLLSVGVLAGRTRWQRFAWFSIAFALWDIWYYIWLKVFLNWPSSLLDWDILFLIPLPWIGPVIAPVLVSILLMTAGLLILREEEMGRPFVPPLRSWILAIAGVAVILASFLRDTPATLHGMMPQPYMYWLFAVGMILLCGSLWESLRQTEQGNEDQRQ